eukprot:9359478-Pyramimonas_sp.AAC.1
MWQDFASHGMVLRHAPRLKARRSMQVTATFSLFSLSARAEARFEQGGACLKGFYPPSRALP